MADEFAQGLQVNPGEIEEVLRRHPEISDAAVVGIEDEISGERPLAFVVTKDSNLMSQDRERLIMELEERVKSQLDESYWLRKQIWFVEELPKSQSGKVLKKALRAKVQKYGCGSLNTDRSAATAVLA
jgi:acyl-coenzyme A synthetase/AMP-(fatty) acid ligase